MCFNGTSELTHAHEEAGGAYGDSPVANENQGSGQAASLTQSPGIQQLLPENITGRWTGACSVPKPACQAQ